MKLTTKSLKFDEITSEVVKKLIGKVLEEYSLKEDDVEYVTKGIAVTETKADATERTIVSYINTAARDRDNEIIVPKGVQLKEYKKNPVVMFCHNYSMLPVGKNLWIKSDGNGLIAKTQYAKHEKANEIYEYRKDGFPLAESIGFIPLKTLKPADALDEELEKLGLDPEEARKASLIYTKWILLEYSDVPVPANPEALQLAVSKGLISKEDSKKFEIEIEETKAFNYRCTKCAYELSLKSQREKWECPVCKAVMQEVKTEDPSRRVYCTDGKEGSLEVTRKDVGDKLYEKLLSENPPDKDDPDVREFLQKLSKSSDSCLDCDLEKEYGIGKDIEFSEDEYIDKSLVEKPYANEHACRLLKPGDFDRFARKNCYVKHDGKCIDYIFGIKENKAKVQAMRYPKDIWAVASAKSHCKSKKGTFEAAKSLELATSIEHLDNTQKLFKALELEGGIAFACESPEAVAVIEMFSKILLEKVAERNIVIELEESSKDKEDELEIELEDEDLSADQIKNVISKAMKELASETKLDVEDLVKETFRKLQGKVV